MEKIRITVKLNNSEVVYEEPYEPLDYPRISAMNKFGLGNDAKSHSERMMEQITAIADKVIEMDKSTGI